MCPRGIETDGGCTKKTEESISLFWVGIGAENLYDPGCDGVKGLALAFHRKGI